MPKLRKKVETRRKLRVGERVLPSGQIETLAVRLQFIQDAVNSGEFDTANAEMRSLIRQVTMKHGPPIWFEDGQTTGYCEES